MDEKYSIEKCAEWINSNHYRKVCLQFPDELLEDAVYVADALTKHTSVILFILGDTSFRSCCVDYVAVKHVKAEAVIHFGRACLSSGQPCPVFFVFPKKILDTPAFIECVTAFLKQSVCNVVLLYDIVFAHYRDEISAKLSSFHDRVNVSQLLLHEHENDEDTLNQASNRKVIKKFGRKYSISFNNEQEDIAYLYLACSDNKRNWENFVLSSPDGAFFSYDCSANFLRKEYIPKTIKKKLYNVEKVREAQKIGILVATLEMDSFLDALQRIKILCDLKKKKSYIISVGKLNVAKLANFLEIDLFVMVACPEAEIANEKDYFQPIVSVMEVELALNDNQSWMGKFVSDFREFLWDGSEYKSIEEQRVVTYTDVSLLSNRLVGFDTCFNDGDILPEKKTAHSSTISLRNVSDNLVHRSWKGLQTEPEHTPLRKAMPGRDGTPARGYKNEPSDYAT